MQKCLSLAIIKKTNYMKIPMNLPEHKYYQDWRTYNIINPHIYSEIIYELERAKNAGLHKVSIKQIIGAIRWNNNIKTKSDHFKINDKFTSIYAAVIAHNRKDLALMFDQRVLRATN